MRPGEVADLIFLLTQIRSEFMNEDDRITDAVVLEVELYSRHIDVRHCIIPGEKHSLATKNCEAETSNPSSVVIVFWRRTACNDRDMSFRRGSLQHRNVITVGHH